MWTICIPLRDMPNESVHTFAKCAECGKSTNRFVQCVLRSESVRLCRICGMKLCVLIMSAKQNVAYSPSMLKKPSIFVDYAMLKKTLRIRRLC
jgi:hypothetical protein